MIFSHKIACTTLVLVCTISVTMAQGPYAPPAGQTGSDAIPADSPVISAWASQATIVRGPMNIANTTAGNASAGNELSPLGKAGENGIVSLGDGGTAILTFNEPISDHPGPDFAVFENSFSDDFLELAFVEVSSDGTNFVRFEAFSNTDTTQQVASFGTIDATDIHHLAGKYRGGYGTPFDLKTLEGKAGLDISNVTHVKIVDVVGALDPAYRTVDSRGWPVNDPWPTEFPSSGFDLDAVGVVDPSVSGVAEKEEEMLRIYPNPATDILQLSRNRGGAGRIYLSDLYGRTLLSFELAAGELRTQISLREHGLASGQYLLHFTDADHHIARVLVVTEN